MKFKAEDFTGPFKDGSTGLCGWVNERHAFGHAFEPLFTAEMCAHNANLLLQKWLDSAQEVYGREEGPFFTFEGLPAPFHKGVDKLVTHKAKLVCVEKLKG